MLTDLDVVVVNYNSGPWLERCLLALKSAGIPGRNVALVDNGSTDVSKWIVRRAARRMHVVHRPDNLGYASSVNAGARVVRHSPYLLVVNADTIVSKEAVTGLLLTLKKNLRVAAASCRTLTSDGIDTTRVKRTSSVRMSGQLLFPRVWPIVRRAVHRARPQTPIEVRFIEDSCILFRRRPFDDAGGFDERFRIHGQDADICIRLRKAGWKLVHDPRITVVHVGGVALDKIPFERTRSMVHGVLLLLWTHAPRRWKWSTRLIGAVLAVCWVKARILGASRDTEFFSAVRSEVRRRLYVRPPVSRTPGGLEAPALSVVIPTADRKPTLNRMLASLGRKDRANVELLVIDQSKGSASLSATARRTVRLLHRRTAHRGLARNLGLQHATGKTILYCDDDIIAPPGFLAAHATAHAGMPRLGITFRMIEKNRGSQPGPVLRVSRSGRLHVNFGADTAVAVGYLCGGNMSVPALELSACGGFDAAYRGTGVLEEADLCSRLRALGVKLEFRPEPAVVHDPQSGGNVALRERDPARYYFLFHHNLVYYFLKNEPRWSVIAALVTAGARSIRQAWRFGASLQSMLFMFRGAIAGSRTYSNMVRR